MTTNQTQNPASPTKRNPEKKGENGKRKRTKRIFGLALAVLISGGAFLIVRSVLFGNNRKPYEVVVPAIPKITLLECHYEKDTAYFSLHCLLQNRSPFRMNIDSVNLRLMVSGKQVVAERQQLGIRLAHMQTDSAVLKLKVGCRWLKHHVMRISKSEQADIEINADIVYNTVAGDRKIAADRAFKLKLPVPPDFRMLGIKVRKINAFNRSMTATFSMQIRNNDRQLRLEMSQIAYDINIAEELKSHGQLRRLKLEPLQTSTIRLSGQLAVKTPLITLGQVATDTDRLKYSLKASGLIRGKKQEIPVLITANGLIELYDEQKKKTK